MPSPHSLDRVIGPSYLCPQTLYKLHPVFDKVLADVLLGDPCGTLHLLHGSAEMWDVAVIRRLTQAVAGAAGIQGESQGTRVRLPYTLDLFVRARVIEWWSWSGRKSGLLLKSSLVSSLLDSLLSISRIHTLCAAFHRSCWINALYAPCGIVCAVGAALLGPNLDIRPGMFSPSTVPEARCGALAALAPVLSRVVMGPQRGHNAFLELSAMADVVIDRFE